MEALADGSGGSAEAQACLVPRSLYIHVPVCASKCAYCDFFSLPAASWSESRMAGLVDATISRLAGLISRFGCDGFDTVYIGGGTPTALPAALFDRLLSGVAALAASPGEWTVEANPESLDEGAIATMLARGVSRVSLGVQSLDPARLAILGRPHSAESATRALALAAGSGMRVSADLIAGIPWPRGAGGAAEGPSLAEQVSLLLDLGIAHLSVYDLVLEDDTALARAVEAGELEVPQEDDLAEERDGAEAVLSARGFRRYEVSNYAPAGLECAHNLVYWKMGSYIGSGPGAVSTLQATGPSPWGRAAWPSSLRIEEAQEIDGYAKGGAVESPIGTKESAYETIMMSFRTVFGLDKTAFRRRFGIEARSLIGRTLEAWAGQLIETRDSLSLDPGGLDLLNRFLVDCLIELDGTFPAPGQS